ncbi:hypothetical protein PAEVO_03130 [Paenibacillus sp. GM2FR]|nr:hypothetical protein PAEVO_03130 [Paenibacillus sp. GM2FR]
MALFSKNDNIVILLKRSYNAFIYFTTMMMTTFFCLRQDIEITSRC